MSVEEKKLSELLDEEVLAELIKRVEQQIQTYPTDYNDAVSRWQRDRRRRLINDAKAIYYNDHG